MLQVCVRGYLRCASIVSLRDAEDIGAPGRNLRNELPNGIGKNPVGMAQLSLEMTRGVEPRVAFVAHGPEELRPGIEELPVLHLQQFG